MLSFSAATRAIFNGMFGWPKSIWYGLCAGLISGMLWTMMALVSASGPLTPNLALAILAFAIDLAPIALVGASGVWLGRRNGSVRDGLMAGMIAGGVLALAYSAAVEIILLHTAIGETLAWHTNAGLVLLEYAKDDLLGALFYAVIGAIVGSLSALVGRRWYRRDQLAWRESVGLAVRGIDTAELDAELLEIITAEALGGQLPSLAE